jgi:tyrosyl-tRNA synthetase
VFVHGDAEYQKAIETTAKLFASQNAAAEDLSIEDLNSMEGIIKKDVDQNKIASGIDVISLLADTEVFPSRGEARKMIQNGGLSINRKKITDAQQIINNEWLLHEQYLLIQKGKKNYFLVKAV